MEITKDTIIGDVLDIAPECAPLFLEIGMHCLGCAIATGESLEDAAAAHGIELKDLLTALNK